MVKVEIQNEQSKKEAKLSYWCEHNRFCFTLYAIEKITIKAKGSGWVKTGVSVAPLPGGDIQICSYDSLLLSYGVGVFKEMETIEPENREKIKVLLRNTGNKDFHIRLGDPVAELVIPESTGDVLIKTPQGLVIYVKKEWNL